MFTSRRRVQIEWGDCDPANIVFYPRYFEWFDASTSHHFAIAGLTKTDLINRYGVIGYPMLETRAQFNAPSSVGDEVTIETATTRFGRSSFDVHHRLLRGDALAVKASRSESWPQGLLTAKASSRFRFRMRSRHCSIDRGMGTRAPRLMTNLSMVIGPNADVRVDRYCHPRLTCSAQTTNRAYCRGL